MRSATTPTNIALAKIIAQAKAASASRDRAEKQTTFRAGGHAEIVGAPTVPTIRMDLRPTAADREPVWRADVQG
jgi:hypothetical protein